MLSSLFVAVFGDKAVELKVPSSMVRAGKPSASRVFAHKGYRVRVEASKVIVTPRNSWRALIGLPSLYHFVGRLPGPNPVGGTVSIPGKVTMKPAEKAFLSVWLGLLVIFVAVSLVLALATAARFVLSPNGVPPGDLAAIGLMLGGGSLVALFGVATVGLVRLVFRDQLHDLLDLCDQTNDAAPSR